jgi:hypothetical protein
MTNTTAWTLVYWPPDPSGDAVSVEFPTEALADAAAAAAELGLKAYRVYQEA